jgi:hypothetical protein
MTKVRIIYITGSVNWVKFRIRVRGRVSYVHLTFTFYYLTDALIQSDLQLVN